MATNGSRRELEQAVGHAGASEVESLFHLFSPGGLSRTIVIAESNDTLHTWPEIDYAAKEAISCGDLSPPKRVEGLIIYLSAARRQKAT